MSSSINNIISDIVPLAILTGNGPLLNLNFTWTQIETTGDKPGERAYAASTTNGRHIFLFGGMRPDYAVPSTAPIYDDLLRFDSVTRVWEQMNPGGTLPGPRGGSILERIGNKLYLHGGGFFEFDEFFTHDFTDQLFQYDIDTNTWSFLDPPVKPPARIFHSSAVLHGELYIFGGTANDFSVLNDLWKYNPTANTWTQIVNGTAPEARNDALMLRYPPGLIMAGGQTFEGFTPSPNDETWRWSQMGGWTHNPASDLPLPLNGMQFCIYLGKPLLFGGDTTTSDEIPPDFFPRKNIKDDTMLFRHNEWYILNTSTKAPPTEYGIMENSRGTPHLVTGYNLTYDLTDPENITFTQTFLTEVWILELAGFV